MHPAVEPFLTVEEREDISSLCVAVANASKADRAIVGFWDRHASRMAGLRAAIRRHERAATARWAESLELER